MRDQQRIEILRKALGIIANNLVDRGSKGQLENQIDYAIGAARTALTDTAVNEAASSLDILTGGYKLALR